MSIRATPPSHIDLPDYQRPGPDSKWGLVLRAQGYTTIDSFVLSNLLRPSFPDFLNSLTAVEITRCVTPPLFWGGDPSYPPDKYEKLFKAAMYTARAYTLLSTPPQYASLNLNNPRAFPFTRLPVELRLQIYEHFEVRHNARQRIWTEVVNTIFTKALFSGRDPEPSARYIAGLLIIACGKSLSQTPHLKGKGKDWCWMNDTMDADATWNWEDVCTAVMSTEKLSRDCTDWEDCQRRINAVPGGSMTDFEYVPQEVLDVFDAARYRLKGKMQDLSVEEVLDLLPASSTGKDV